MNRDPVTLVTRVLADRAAAVSAPPAGLADAARRQARARRRNQGIGVTLGAALVVTLLLSLGVLPQGRGQVEQLPARSTPPLTVPDGVLTRVAPDTLARGADPAVAWTADAVLHRTDGRSLALPLGPVPAAETPDGGAFIADSRTSDAALRRVDADGQGGPAMDVSWPVVGAHDQVGYLDRGRGRLVTELPGGTGSTVGVPFDVSGATLVGWLGDSALVANVPGESARVISTDGTVRPLRGLAQATATDGLATVASRSADGSCLEVRRDDRLLWRSCDNARGFRSIVAFSPDSHHALVRRGTSAGGGEYAVVDTETGDVVRLFTVAAPAGTRAGLGQAVFETDEDVLIAVVVGPGESIVRCSLAGACELAVPHADMADGSAGPQPFDPAWVP